MRLLGTVAGAALGVLAMVGLSAPVAAALITGSINMAGGVRALDGGAGGSATNNFLNADYLDIDPAGGGSGSFTVINNATGDLTIFNGASGSILDFSYDPATAPLNDFYTVTVGLNTLVFDLSTLVVEVRTSTALTLSGTGILSLTGFDDTEGVWRLTTQRAGGGVNLSFSSTTSAVPEPATLAILGFGLAGLGVVARRRQQG